MPRPAVFAIFILAAGAAVPLIAGGVPATLAETSTPRVDHAAFDRILADVVRGEFVDYARLDTRHRRALEAYLRQLAGIRAGGLPRDAQLAYFINLYNASVLREVAARYEPGFSVSRDEFSIFDRPVVALRDRHVTLNQLEHQIIRPGFEEPRVHVALVCAARSCPPLLPRAYRADELEETLERNMTRFINDGVRNRIDVASRRVRLSRLFDWYAADFGGKRGRLAYVDRYAEQEVGGFSVEFLEYDWTLNDAPRP